MDNLAIFSISLLLQKGIGFAGFNNLLEKFGTIDNLYAYASKNIHSPIVTDRLSAIIFKAYQSTSDFKNYGEKEGLEYTLIWQDNYPELLKQIPDAPSVLFYKGDLSAINWKKSISIVGTRKITEYGKKHTQNLTEDLAKNGLTIVSGMAFGVDELAHTTAIKNNTKTVAVLASSVHIPTPETNRKIYNSILDSGGVIVSETFPHQKVMPGMFAKRNHLIAGLTAATLVTEAPAKSGALITARLALDYNRMVFAIPGDVTRTSTEGNNNLIKENVAKLVNKSEDLLEEFGLNNVYLEKEILLGLTKEGKSIYDLLASNAKNIDEMAEETDFEINQLTKICFDLEIQGILRKTLDGRYSLV